MEQQLLTAGANGGPAEPEVIGISPERGEDGNLPSTLPILPTRGVVVFPRTVVPLTIRRPSTRKLVEETVPKSPYIGLVAQRDPEEDAPTPEGLHRVGSVGKVLKLLRQPDDGVIVVVEAIRRFSIRHVVRTEPYFQAEIELLGESAPAASDAQWEATLRGLRDTALKLVRLNPELPEQIGVLVANIEEAGHLADFVAANLGLELARKQELLEETDVEKRVRSIHQIATGQLEIAQIQEKLQRDVEAHFSEAQRRAYLREQLRAIQRELGEAGGADEQAALLRSRLEEAKLPEEAMATVERELKRLDVVPAASPEYSVIVNYLEILAEMPWQKLSEDHFDLDEAQRILDRDHYDLEKIKQRLIEYLAVRKLNPRGRGPILCFVGPPGVGKTSLGQSIADALGRRFSRMSLGGIRDEAEVRGHRRTYIGAMPGRIAQELRRVGTRNPVLMLDEIDKLGADFRGDPASALLEVLDPRQNDAFVDRYLDVPFDLSQVIFIATANYMDPVPPALRDRMEVIRLPGYADPQKREIARRYLIPRQLAENGLTEENADWRPEAVDAVIADYTREAGVRELERQIGAVCRGIAARVARGDRRRIAVDPALVEDFLGPPKHVRETRLKTSVPGVVTGLAYTPMGGEVLHVEAIRFPGKGEITLTGQIGSVMKESVQAAWSLVKSRAGPLGIPAEAFRESDVHVHVPSGAIPKDGPSAGVAMFTAIASLLTGAPVAADVAMTGEITLRGLVLPIGGLKEKCLAALQAGIDRVILPKLNERDLVELPEEARKRLRFVLAENVDEVLEAALEERRQPSPAREEVAAI